MSSFPISEDVDIIADMKQSVIASCVAYGSPSPKISWSLLQRNTTFQTIGTNRTDSSVHTRQFVRNGVGIVYSALLLCPTLSGTTSQVSCSASNGVDGGNMTLHSFLINVTGETERERKLLDFLFEFTLPLS